MADSDYILRRYACPQAVTHPSSNRAQCRLTTLVEANMLTTTPRHCCCCCADDIVWSVHQVCDDIVILHLSYLAYPHYIITVHIYGLLHSVVLDAIVFKVTYTVIRLLP